jgi:hypothetical protein
MGFPGCCRKTQNTSDKKYERGSTEAEGHLIQDQESFPEDVTLIEA